MHKSEKRFKFKIYWLMLFVRNNMKFLAIATEASCFKILCRFSSLFLFLDFAFSLISFKIIVAAFAPATANRNAPTPSDIMQATKVKLFKTSMHCIEAAIK